MGRYSSSHWREASGSEATSPKPRQGRHSSLAQMRVAPCRGLGDINGNFIPPARAGGKQSVTPLGVQESRPHEWMRPGESRSRDEKSEKLLRPQVQRLG